MHPSWSTQLDFDKIEELVCEDRRTTWLQLQCPKSGEVDLLQFQHGNGTAIKGGDGWRTHRLGSEALQRWAAERCLLVDMTVGKWCMERR